MAKTAIYMFFFMRVNIKFLNQFYIRGLKLRIILFFSNLHLPHGLFHELNPFKSSAVFFFLCNQSPESIQIVIAFGSHPFFKVIAKHFKIFNPVLIQGRA